VIDFDSDAALAYARIRKDRSVRPPDAIQLACAATGEMELFITNDDRLSQKTVEGIHFIVSLERALI
jgi:predicted nucleic acid-binding protein